MANLGVSEVVFGGVGTGLYSMLVYVLLAVFIGGLMVGRTPEYLGKKIEAREIKLVSLAIAGDAADGAVARRVWRSRPHAGRTSIPTPRSGARRASPRPSTPTSSRPTTTARRSPATPGYVQPNAGNVGAHGVKLADLMGGLTMLFARFIPILLVLAIAGALAGKRIAPAGPGTMRTDNDDVRRPADRRRDPRRRAHLLPRPAARTGRAEPDHAPLLAHAPRTSSHPRSRSSS